MSAPSDKSAQDAFFPPPPPGPPPGHHTAVHPLQQHPNTAPSGNHNIPAYDPSKLEAPHFAVPPNEAADLYNVTPLEQPHRQAQQEHHGQPLQQEHQGQVPQQQQYQQSEVAGPHSGDGSKAGGAWSQKLAGWGSKAAAPFNAMANKIGSEAFLPMTMDKECEKAARILRGFCKDGIYSDTAHPTLPSQTAASSHPTTATYEDIKTSTSTKPAADTTKPGSKPKVLLTIPSKVIARAHGLAIFTTVRAGFHVSGSSGSGILVARLPDGSWSPPSGIQVHSLGAGFVLGLDIYDCVVVINTPEALKAFTSTRVSLGSDLAVTAGPWGAGGAVDWGVGAGAGNKKDREGRSEEKANLAAPGTTAGQNTSGPAGDAVGAASSSKDRKLSPFRDAIKKPVYSYVKSRGFYAGVQVDGTVVTERKDANAAFYGEPGITVDRILQGAVRSQTESTLWPTASKGLIDTIKGAEGWHGQQQSGHGVPSALHAQPVGQGHPHASGFGGRAGPAATSLATSATATGHYSKEDEAAAERRANEPLSAAPPSYNTGQTGTQEYMPPAYVDDGVPRAGVGDNKTRHH